mmetsp:Transcript_64865/g.101095  ORF Transcript_64865/g.101095 Transcript_64865/m.101095 type:complete len:212 (-) Transcript_64865:40-675(-)
MEPAPPSEKSEPSALTQALRTWWKKYQEANDFWFMTWPQQKLTLRNTFVYILFGLACAVLYRHLQLKRVGIFDPAELRGNIVNDKDFSFSLFGCFEDLKICLLGCCCPFSRWADTIDRQFSFGFWQYWKAFAVMFFLFVLNPYTAGLSCFAICIIGTLFRQNLRRKFKIEYATPKTYCLDFLTWCCCHPCAICQEAREEHLRFPSSGKTDS